MKTNFLKKLSSVALACLFLAAFSAHAQQRGGGGSGGGFGGFGGFGGGGGGGGFNRGSSSSSSSSYNNNGTVGNAVISVDPMTHNIVVIADKATSEQIRRVIENMDVPVPQVLIKVIFLEVQHNNSQEIGIQGQYTGNPFGNSIAQITGYVTNFGVNNVLSAVQLPNSTTANNSTTTSSGSTSTTTSTSSSANSYFFNNAPTIAPVSVTPIYQTISAGNNFSLPQALTGAAGSGGLYQLLGRDFTATIQAIAAAGKSQVLSRPSILARDGQIAKIVVGQDIYLPSGVSYNTVGTTTTPIINGTYQPVGIILYVTPFIGQNGLVEMIVQPQTSSVDSSSPGQVIATGGILGSPVYAPTLNMRSADTVVVTPNGQTVVIGGLISNSKSTAETKVPFLGDIPILGQLFRSNSKAENRTELMMFLTPHIVDAPAQLAALNIPEMGQAPLITNSISEQELDRFLDRVPAKKPEPTKKKK
jgi:general secretion pathway protein D